MQQMPSFSSEVGGRPQAFEPPGMTVIAKRLLERELSQLSEHATHRTRCTDEWARTFREAIPMGGYDVMPANQVPYLACVTAANQATAESLYVRLHQAGVPASTWPDLPPEVAASTQHKIGQQLRNTRLYVPVHRSVTAGQIAACGNRLRNADLAGWRLRKIVNKTEWENLWLGCRRKSLPQTWEYGEAKAMAEGWQVQRFVVLDEEGLSIALFQVLIKGLPGLGGGARVNRGPLMLRAEDDESNNLALQAIAVLARESKWRRWWMMQLAPLLPPGAAVEDRMRAMNFRRQPICPMDSALLSLERGEEELMKGLNGKWRNCLRKGQKLGVTVKLDQGGREHFQWLLDFYRMQQHEKSFEGTSDSMLQALVANQSQSFKFNLYLALNDGVADETALLGVLVTLQFGDVSEYLIGATNEKGRASQANSVLLWEAILDAKRNGCRWFDVGGLAENTPKGIADFKKGLNPEPYALAGEWRKWL